MIKFFKKKEQGEYDGYSPFEENHSSSNTPENLVIRYANLEDANDIAQITYDNSGDDSLDLKYFVNRTRSELAHGGNIPGFHLIVALVDSEVVAYARSIYYKQEVIKKYVYPAPVGWYLMGVTVKPSHRGQGIGRELTRFRVNHISKISNTIYYVVNKNNKSSIKMHESFGFKHLKDGPGFLKVKFNGGTGCLYQYKK